MKFCLYSTVCIQLLVGTSQQTVAITVAVTCEKDGARNGLHMLSLNLVSLLFGTSVPTFKKKIDLYILHFPFLFSTSTSMQFYVTFPHLSIIHDFTMVLSLAL